MNEKAAGARFVLAFQKRRITMLNRPSRRQFVRQTAAFGLTAGLLPGFAAAQDRDGDSFTLDRSGDLARIESNFDESCKK